MPFIHLNPKTMQGKKTKIVDFISKLFGVKSKSKIWTNPEKKSYRN